MQMTGIPLMYKCDVSFISIFNNIHISHMYKCLPISFFFLICLSN